MSGRSNLTSKGDTNLYCQNCFRGNRKYRVNGNRPAEHRIELPMLLKVGTELLVLFVRCGIRVVC